MPLIDELDLSPSTRTRVEGALADITRALERPIDDIDYDPRVATSLYTREPGFAVYLGYLDRLRPRRRWRQLAERFITTAIGQTQAASDRPFFSYGFSGMGWAIHHLHGWFLRIDPDVLDDLDDALLMLVREAPGLPYDLQHGLVGFGVYALERRSTVKGRRLLREVIARLTARAERHAMGVRWKTVVAEYVPVRFEPEPYLAAVMNGGAGVVGLLGAAIAEGVEVDAARALLIPALEGVWAARERGLFRARFQLAWATGSLGVGAVVHAAATAARLPTWQRRAIRLARLLAEGQWRIRDTSLLAGATSALHLYARLFRATRDPTMRAATRHWLLRLLARRRPGVGLEGFYIVNEAWQRRFVGDMTIPVGKVGAPGITHGIAGVGLALLNLLDDREPSWDRMLLLS